MINTLHYRDIYVILLIKVFKNLQPIIAAINFIPAFSQCMQEPKLRPYVNEC